MMNRFDDTKARFAITKTNDLMSNIDNPIKDNSITFNHLGFHINPHGTGKLAINFIKTLKKLHVSEMVPPSSWTNDLKNKHFEMPREVTTHTPQRK